MACVQSIQIYACANGSGTTDPGSTAIGNWGVRVAQSDAFREQPYDAVTEVNLATGILRQKLMFSGSPANPSDENQLSTYADLFDDVTFHGTGTAVFSAAVTGEFLGDANLLYYNYYDFFISAFSSLGGDITGSLDMRFRLSDQVNIGQNCGSVWALGTVGCTIVDNTPGHVVANIWLNLDDIHDGETITFVTHGQTGAYAPRNGGVDFGHTARLGLTTSNGLTWTSASGAFLTQQDVTATPEPGSFILLASGIGALGLAFRRRQRSED